MMKRTFPLLVVVLVLVLGAGTAMAQQDHKYALSVFHFNIQYVIGGLYGFVPLEPDFPAWEIGPDAAEDMIVEESFAPILDLLDEHPDWTLTLELQAYFIEVLAERHPDVLDQLRDLVDSGGVELVSFHYADQLFIAFPYEDWQRSNDLAQDVFEQYDLELSGAVFCQEGQGAEGMARRMEETGYTVMAWPKNLWKYQHGDWDPAPYYTFGNIHMVTAAKGVNDPVNGVYTTWTFMGDGELLATGDWDPYFPWFFKYRPQAVEEYETHLQDLVDQGYVISGIEDYVNDMITLGIDPGEPPRLLDGTWQPGSTESVSMWLGRGGLWRKDERDNHVRTLCNMAHREIKAADTIAAEAGLDREEELFEAWRNLFMSEVSDGSGINPYRGEMEFTVASAAEAIRVSRDIIDEAKAELAMDSVLIDTAAGTVDEGEFSWPGEPVNGPVNVTVRALGREYEQHWYQLSNDPKTYRLEINFTAGTDKKHREMSVTFPGWADDFLTTTALIDDEVQAYPRADFTLENNHMYLPGPIGLFGIGRGWWVVKDMANVHLAGLIYQNKKDLRFEDLTAPWFETITWVFYLVKGDEADALALADSVNVHPTLAR